MVLSSQAQLRMQCDSTAKTLSGRSQALNTSKAELKDWEAKAAELQKQVRASKGMHATIASYEMRRLLASSADQD